MVLNVYHYFANNQILIPWNECLNNLTWKKEKNIFGMVNSVLYNFNELMLFENALMLPYDGDMYRLQNSYTFNSFYLQQVHM